MAERARIVLAFVRGKPNDQVATEMGIHADLAGQSRRRSAGLRDEPKLRKPAKYGVELRNRILTQLPLPPPQGMANWDGDLLAAMLSGSDGAGWRSGALPATPHLPRGANFFLDPFLRNERQLQRNPAYSAPYSPSPEIACRFDDRFGPGRCPLKVRQRHRKPHSTGTQVQDQPRIFNRLPWHGLGAVVEDPQFA